jgi:3-hydroxy-9,10-secoandrosta-1,3,5(10)-triene-9,17-dione monooxygenase reductase component
MTTAPNFDPRSLRDALGSFATGVTIVTTVDQAGHDVGLTANSFNSVSLDPPMVLWSLAKTSLSLDAFKQATYFAVHILGAQQEQLSNLFAKRGVDKFAGLDLARGHGNIPLLKDCAARFQCKTAFAYEGGDHVIFVGQVLDFDDFKRAPLVFQGGKYALAVKKPAPRVPAADTAETGANFTRDYLGSLLSVAHAQMKTRLRPALEARGLDEEDYGVLSMLILWDDREATEIDNLLHVAGRKLDDAKVRELTQKNLIAAHPDAQGHMVLSLTDKGRQIAIELMAAAKAVEADSEIGLDFSESQMLKHLLKRVIRTTMPGDLKIWRDKT